MRLISRHLPTDEWCRQANLCLKYLLLTIRQAVTVLYRFLTVHIFFKGCQFTVGICFHWVITWIAYLHMFFIDRWRYGIVPWNAPNIVVGILHPALKYASFLRVFIEHAVSFLKKSVMEMTLIYWTIETKGYPCSSWNWHPLLSLCKSLIAGDAVCWIGVIFTV